MPFFTDQLGREVEILKPPQRIVSVVPSQTELLFDLDLEKEVVGITKFCVHPHTWFRNKTRVGGTKNLNIDKIISLQPQLILANKEENVQSQIEALASMFPIWISDINNLDEAIQMIDSIGSITNKVSKANDIIQSIRNDFSKITLPHNANATAYLIWKDPYMTVGGDTFIHSMLKRGGFNNIFEQSTRYPIVTVEDLKEKKCDLLLLSSEPYPFKQKHIDELQLHLPNTKIILIDGEMFSWYGSRLVKSAQYFHELQHQIQAIA